jgi:hypothetical protein
VDVNGCETWSGNACVAHAIWAWAHWLLYRLPSIVYHSVRVLMIRPVDEAWRERIQTHVAELCVAVEWAWHFIGAHNAQ